MIPRPKSVQIGSRIYQIIIDPNLQLNEGLVGSCNHQRLVIELLPRHYSSQVDEALWHEILHAINTVYLSSKLSEDDVSNMSEGLAQVLQGSGITFEWEQEAMRKD